MQISTRDGVNDGGVGEGEDEGGEEGCGRPGYVAHGLEHGESKGNIESKRIFSEY